MNETITFVCGCRTNDKRQLVCLSGDIAVIFETNSSYSVYNIIENTHPTMELDLFVNFHPHTSRPDHINHTKGICSYKGL